MPLVFQENHCPETCSERAESDHAGAEAGGGLRNPLRRWEFDAIASHTAAPPTQPNRTSLSSLSPAIDQTT